MSHFTKIKTEIVEEQYLLKALEATGWKYKHGNTLVRGWQGQMIFADIWIDVPGTSNQIGMTKKGNSYEVIADWYMIKTTNEADFVKNLTQAYACEVVKGKLAAQGFELARQEKKKDNSVHLVLRRKTR